MAARRICARLPDGSAPWCNVAEMRKARPGQVILVAAVALAIAGCGGSSEQKSTAAAADVKAQVEQVCREATVSIDGLPEAVDSNAAIEGQTRSAQIFKTAVGKLNELNNDVGLPGSYKSWLAAFEQLPALNEKAAEAFTQDGIASGQAAQAADAWESQAEKADALAGKAGLTGCEFGPGSTS